MESKERTARCLQKNLGRCSQKSFFFDAFNEVDGVKGANCKMLAKDAFKGMGCGMLSKESEDD